MNQGSEKRSLLLNRNRVRVWKPWKHTPPYSNFPYLPLPPPTLQLAVTPPHNDRDKRSVTNSSLLLIPSIIVLNPKI